MFNRFSKEKSDFLKKKDKSKKGCVDEDIKDIVNAINSKKDYYTTSSCAGRIVLLEMKSRRKNECRWILTKHNKIKHNEILNTLKNYNKNKKINNPIWFRQQPLILHVACRNLDSAKKFLEIARKIFRRAGIIGITDKKVMIEIIGDERMDTIISDKNFAADEKYLRNLVKYANRNFKENRKKNRGFLKLFKN